MKLRRQTNDFIVQEENNLPLVRTGKFAVYELRKTGWNTLDAIQSLAIQLKRPVHDFSHAGLKDRHAETTQWITIQNGPTRNFKTENISLEYLGQAERGTTAQDIVSNRFTLVLRSLNAVERASAESALPTIRNAGIANYFDDQRFGSYIPGQPFIAEHWIRGEYEKALWLTFAERHPQDDGAEREQKDLLREHWGDWKQCKAVLSRSHRRSIMTFLDDRHDDFKGAWACVNSEMRGLYLTAFQSHLWNRMLNRLFHLHCEPTQLTECHLKTGAFLIPTSLTIKQQSTLHQVEMPLPSARLKLDDPQLLGLINTTLTELGWRLQDLKVRHPRDRFFPKASRRAMIPVNGLEAEFAVDELSPEESKLTISFSLPRGCYATMLVKRLMLDVPV